MAATPQSTPVHQVEGPAFNRINVEDLANVVLPAGQGGFISDASTLVYQAATSSWIITHP